MRLPRGAGEEKAASASPPGTGGEDGNFPQFWTRALERVESPEKEVFDERDGQR